MRRRCSDAGAQGARSRRASLLSLSDPGSYSGAPRLSAQSRQDHIYFLIGLYMRLSHRGPRARSGRPRPARSRVARRVPRWAPQRAPCSAPRARRCARRHPRRRGSPVPRPSTSDGSRRLSTTVTADTWIGDQVALLGATPGRVEPHLAVGSIDPHHRRVRRAVAAQRRHDGEVALAQEASCWSLSSCTGRPPESCHRAPSPTGR